MARLRLAKKPKLRMRTKPCGRMCSKKRHRNSSTDRGSNFCLLWSAESRQRKVTWPSVRETSKLERVKRANKRALAEKFNKLDLHDDGLRAIKIYPPRKRSNFTRIDFEFQDDSTGSRKALSFHSCANIRFVMDFDVLADNWHLGNTEACVAKTEVRRMKKFVRAQMSHWRTTYMPPMRKNEPIRKKFASIRSYVLFRVAFFGGTAEILAKGYKFNN